MNRCMYVVGLAMTFWWGMGLTLAQTNDEVVPKCPVMGGPANLAISVPTDDGPVFFCCKGCIGKYQADPGKYAAAAAEQRKALASRPKVQVTCPVNGEPADKDMSLEHAGQKVYFCSEDCRAKYKEAPDKFKKALANSYTYQATCPVMGGPIDPKAFTVLPSGERIYYCCKGCDKKLLTDPAKYLPKLAEQGIKIDIDAVKEAGKHDGGDHGHHDGD